MKYICEDCSKIFDTEKEALNCEKVHKEEKVRKAKIAEQKQERLDEINKDMDNLFKKIEKYQKDYGSIRLYGRNRDLFNWFYDWLI